MSEIRPQSEAQKQVRGSSLMLLGRMISIAINFIVQVLIVRYLAKEGYGAFAYGYSIAALASRMTALGTDKAANRFVPIYHEKHELNRVKGSLLVAFSTIAVTGVLLIGLVISLHGTLAATVVSDPLSLSVLAVIISLAPLLALESLLEKLLAIFGRVKALFVRRYILTPLLRLAAVISLMAYGGDAYFLAGAYVLATLVGVLISAQLLWRILREEELLTQLKKIKSERFTKKWFGFGIPLLSSDVVFGLRTSLVVVLLELFHGTVGVASFRAILPIANLNKVVYDSFRLLYVPTAARMFARDEKHEISELYWRSTAWIGLLTFPLFLISFSLATPTTVLLLGEEYASSGPVLSIVAFSIYLNAAFGFNALTLRVFDRVQTIMKIDMGAGLVALLANLAVVPFYGPLGGAAVSSLVLIAQNVAYHQALTRAGHLARIPGIVARIHLTIIITGCLLLALQFLLSPPWIVSFTLAVIATGAVWLAYFKTLQIRELFPEINRLLPARFRLGDSALSANASAEQI